MRSASSDIGINRTQGPGLAMLVHRGIPELAGW